MACSKENIVLIHKYLDNEMTLLEIKQFQQHINKCSDCEKHLQELRKTEAITQSASHVKAPSNFTENVMGKLPKQPASQKWKHRLRKHPFMITAATFFLVFIISLSSAFGGDGNDIVVKGDGHFIVDEQRGVVVIPEGEHISGDLIVRNGDIEIAGEVTGSITVINGEHLMASADQVSGEIEEINQVMDWLWYETKAFLSEVVAFMSTENEENEENN
ncbi:anti-sigma factor [Salipaludibacillus keqinensis]|uniref:Anti-sigma factor n=1 Tax=Salipaludibacillus keqinensis TaxID=2045207 RepID=A0A323T7J1_9BACI|nr:zf-HC2 domain-containing protein [Salipaludibacillus keqinensis]PYZ91908.1 anti-sigma factor [Salipaludibacillus keqinensis]